MTLKEFKVQLALGSFTTDDLIDIAGDTNTSKKLLKILSNHEYAPIRSWVAKNSNTPKDVLEKLSNDEYWAVRENVANNPNRPITSNDGVANGGKAK